MEITAALTYEPDAPFEIQEVELDDPRDDEVLVRMVAAGICHTDLGVKKGWPTDAGPLVLGHEGAGVVEAVGSDITTLQPGDHVLLSYRSCRTCGPCESGYTSYCERFRELNAVGVRPDGSTTMRRGDQAVHGNFFGQSSFASHALAYASNAVKVDPALDLSLAAPLGCGIQTGAGAVLNVLKPAEGDSFVVFGAGGVGLAGLMAAVHLSVKTAIAVDPVESRRQLATELGATHTIDPTQGNVVEQIHDFTGGGADTAFDTTGIPPVIVDATRALGRLGTIALVGIGEPMATLDIKDIIRSGKSVRGVMEGDADPLTFVPELIDLVQQGRLPIERMIVRYPFADINRAVQDTKTGATIKPVLTF